METACPWDQYTASTKLFCEATVCDWIKQPANTWSTLAYILIGLWIARLAHKEGAPHLAKIGWLNVMIGVTSFAYHGTLTFFSEVLDYSSMFFLVSLVIAVNIKRIGKISFRTESQIYWGLCALAITLLLTVRDVGLVMFPTYAFFYIGTEIYLAKKARKNAAPINHGPQIKWFFTFLTGTLLWLADVAKIFCDPDNHWLQGHALWHIFTAWSAVYLYRHFYQFKTVR